MSKTIRALKAWKNVVITATYKGASVTKNVSVLFTLGADCGTDSGNPTMIYMYDNSASSPYKKFLNYWDSSSYDKNTFLINCYESGTQNSSTKIAASNFTYSSSNTSVATVNTSGVVTYVGNGTATITVTAKSSSNYIGTKVFYVKCQKDGWEDGDIYREPGRVGADDYEVDIYGSPEFDYLEFDNGTEPFLTDGTNRLMGGVSVVNLVDFYIHLDSGFDMAIASYEMAGPVGMIIQSQYNSTNTNQQINRYHLSYEDEYSGIFRVSHDNMGTNLGIDYVVLKAYNAREQEDTGSAQQYITQTFDSLSNSLNTTDKYKNTSGTPGYNTVYGTPTCSVTNQLTAAGGNFYVTCSVTDSTNWYYRYTSGAYSTLQSASQAGTAKWKITAQYVSYADTGDDDMIERFSHPTSGGQSVGGAGMLYPSGSSYKGSHSSMTYDLGTDSVWVRAYNVSDTTKYSGGTSISVVNKIESISLSVAKNPIKVGEVTTGRVDATYTSGYVNNDCGFDSLNSSPTGIIGIDDENLRMSVDNWDFYGVGGYDPNGDLNGIIKDDNSEGAYGGDVYAYTGQTIQYNNQTMYVWKYIGSGDDLEDYNNFANVTFALTNTIDWHTLYSKSIYYHVKDAQDWEYSRDVNLNEHPVIILSGDGNTIGDAYVGNTKVILNAWQLYY